MTIRRRAQLASSAARYRKDLEGRFESETDPVEREVLARELMRLSAQADGPPAPPKKKTPPPEDDMPPKGKPKGPGADAPPPPPGPPGGPGEDEELDLPPMDDEELGGADGDMDSIMEKLDDVADGIDELTDATKETQEILHELHMDEADEADIDKHVRDQKDEVDKNEDDITDEEFGVKDLKSFYGSNKRSGSTMEDLRARRKARLAAAKRKAQSDAGGQYIPKKHDITLEDDHWAAGDQRDDLRSEAPPVEYSGQDIVNRDDEHSKDLPPVWKSVFAPTGSLKAQLSARCIQPKGSASYWLVLRTADRKPIAMVPRPKGTSIAAFNTPDFGRKLLAAITKKGEAVLKALKARPVTADETKPVAAAPTAPVSDAAPADPEQVQGEVRNHMARFRRALNVAIQASNRNLIAPNVLKASFAAVLEERGMDPQEIVAVTEQAFRMGAAKHFDQIVAKALEWMDKDDSNFAEWEQMVRTSSVVMPPVEDGQRYDRHVEAEGLRRRAMEGSFLPTTMGAGMGDEGSDLASRLTAALPKPASWYAMKGLQGPDRTAAGRRAAAR